jgi:phosphomannomutase
VPVPKPLEERVRLFISGDPDPNTRKELTDLLSSAAEDPTALAELEDRFTGPLEFGTAGLRGPLGAGLARMNRAVVLRATAGLVDYVIKQVPDAKSRGMVIGRDARRMSKELQEEAASVALARGVMVHFIAEPLPTPVTAFAVKELQAAAGVMITASHNPPAYNGYKVYWENGAQIVPPHDRAIAERIDAQPAAIDIPHAAFDYAFKTGALVDATRSVEYYLDRLERLRFVPGAPVGELSIAYSALHGVGERTFRHALEQRGFKKLATVPEQGEPDGAFPTVAFPNPEEPGTLDRVLALAKKEGSDLVLVNDPDADRLGAAVRDESGGYVVLSGNEIGALLGHHLLERDGEGGPKRLVMSTIVSSQILRRMAAVFGVHYEETLTGFKWIANDAIALERSAGLRFVFGFEEALGYTIGTIVRDKDGVSAGLVLAEHAAELKGRGKTLLDQLDEIRRRFGCFLTKQKGITLPGREGRDEIERAMARLRSARPNDLAGLAVESVWDLEARTKTHRSGAVEKIDRLSGDVLIFELFGGGRVAIRPSGTEPKIKLYFETVESIAGNEPPEHAEQRGSKRLADLEHSTLDLAGLSHLR